jgi:hypothetical protein
MNPEPDWRDALVELHILAEHGDPDAATRAARWLARDPAARHALTAAAAAAEVVAGPLRRLLQSGNDELRRHMAACDVDERDLTAAWHHLEAGRRATLRERLIALQARVARP